MQELNTPACLDCGGDMMGFRHPAVETGLVWACRACGATFTFDGDYTLQPVLLELYFPACPTCDADMVAEHDTGARGSTTWICRTCGTTFAG